MNFMVVLLFLTCRHIGRVHQSVGAASDISTSEVEVLRRGLAGGDGAVQLALLSRRPEAEEARWPLVTYVSDVEAAMSAAKETAGAKDVLVHGAGTAQLALAAGVLDELQIHLVPVLLGEGRRLFEHLGAEHIELEPTGVVEGDGVTHLRYRVAS